MKIACFNQKINGFGAKRGFYCHLCHPSVIPSVTTQCIEYKRINPKGDRGDSKIVKKYSRGVYTIMPIIMTKEQGIHLLTEQGIHLLTE